MSAERLTQIVSAVENLNRCVDELRKPLSQDDRWGAFLGQCDWYCELHDLLYEGGDVKQKFLVEAKAKYYAEVEAETADEAVDIVVEEAKMNAQWKGGIVVFPG